MDIPVIATYTGWMGDYPEIRYLDRTTPPHIMTLVLLAGLSALSMNVFLPSLPNMTAYFHTDYALMQLSVSLYLALTGVLQLVIGPLSDRYGRRPVVLGGMIIFVAATVGCLFARDITTFLVFRMTQTTIATGMVLSRAIVRDMVPADKSASMIGYVTMGMAVVPMAAPALGGYLDELLGWQANFSILLIMGLLVLAIAWLDLGETNQHQSSSFMAQLGDYPELFRLAEVLGLCPDRRIRKRLFLCFFLVERPLLPRISSASVLPGLGLYFGIVSLGYIVGNFLSGRYSTRLGINRMILTGTLVTLTGLVLSFTFIRLGATHPLSFFGFMLTVGLGNGMVLPNSNAGMLSVRPHLAGSASGLGGAIMLGGGASLAAITGAVLTPGSGPYPLLYLMIGTSTLAVVTIGYVIRVANRKGPLGATEPF